MGSLTRSFGWHANTSHLTLMRISIPFTGVTSILRVVVWWSPTISLYFLQHTNHLMKCGQLCLVANISEIRATRQKFSLSKLDITNHEVNHTLNIFLFYSKEPTEEPKPDHLIKEKGGGKKRRKEKNTIDWFVIIMTIPGQLWYCAGTWPAERIVRKPTSR